MNKLLYRLMYLLGRARWDTGQTPPEVIEAFQQGEIPPGPTLDLGCGTGTNVIYMAQQGRQAIGIDFVPKAIARAREKAQQAGVTGQTQFHVADVTRLDELNLPACAFALDMGCFHGLNPEGQRRYIDSLSRILVPGGRYMLYTLDPRKAAGIAYGIAPEQVTDLFSPCLEMVRTERGAFWSQGSTWFWMRRKEERGSAMKEPGSAPG